MRNQQELKIIDSSLLTDMQYKEKKKSWTTWHFFVSFFFSIFCCLCTKKKFVFFVFIQRICVFRGFEKRKKKVSVFFSISTKLNRKHIYIKSERTMKWFSRVRVTCKSESFYLEAKTSNHQTSSCWTNFCCSSSYSFFFFLLF